MAKFFSRSSVRSGQAMLVAILTIGGAILGATTLAGFLTLYQIRATSDSMNSAKAIFAADSGVNWILYNRLNSTSTPLPSPLGNGATIFVGCYDTNGSSTPTCNDSSATVAFSRGQSLNSLRAFTFGLANATQTVP